MANAGRARPRGRARPPAKPRADAALASHSDAPLTRRGTLGVALALTVAWAVAFAPLLTGRAFIAGDSAAYRPYAELSRARWAQQHDRTLWNPYVFFGLPSAASLADPRPQWLPDPLLSLADAAAPVTERWRVPLAVLAGALAMAALARSLWRCGPEATALAGGGWLLAPLLLVPLAFGHDAEVWTLALWPIVALAARSVLGASEGTAVWRAALLLAGALAFQVLGAHPQFLVYGLIAAAVVALPLVRASSTHARLALAAAIVLALAMSAAVWLPAWRYSAESLRQAPGLMLAESRQFVAGGRDLLAAIWPHAAGFGGASYWGAMHLTDYPHFLGAALAALGLAGAFAARPRSRGTALALAALAAFALCAACGVATPVGRLLAVLPLTGSFRTPITWIALAQFAAALLAARGLDVAGAGRSRTGEWLGVAGALVGLALLATGAGARGLADAMTAARAATPGADWPARVALEAPLAMRDLGLRLVLAGAAVALAFGRGWLPSRFSAPALSGAVLIAALDLGAVAVPIAWRSSGLATALAPPAATPASRTIASDPLHRAMTFDPHQYFSNDWIAWRARSASGLHGAAPRRWHDVHGTSVFVNPGFLRDASLRWLLPSGGSGALAPSLIGAGWRPTPVANLYDNPAALPRVRAVPRVVLLDGDAVVLATLAEPEFAPESLAFTTDSAAAGTYAEPASVRITWREDAPDRIALTVSAPQRAFVVIADAFMAGWSATLDGRALVIHRVDHVFRGLALPVGSHEVRLAYSPPGWKAGVALAWAGWVVFLVALAWSALRSRGPTDASR